MLQEEKRTGMPVPSAAFVVDLQAIDGETDVGSAEFWRLPALGAAGGYLNEC